MCPDLALCPECPQPEASDRVECRRRFVCVRIWRTHESESITHIIHGIWIIHNPDGISIWNVDYPCSIWNMDVWIIHIPCGRMIHVPDGTWMIHIPDGTWIIHILYGIWIIHTPYGIWSIHIPVCMYVCIHTYI